MESSCGVNLTEAKLTSFGRYCLLTQAVKNFKEFLFQAQLKRALNSKMASEELDHIEEQDSEDYHRDQQDGHSRTVSWDKQYLKKTSSPAFRIHVRSPSIEEKERQSTTEHSDQSRLNFYPHKTLTASSFMMENSKSSIYQFKPDQIVFDDRYKYQIELAAKETEIKAEFEKKFRISFNVLRTDERRNCRALLVLIKKACMIFGRFHAELFFRREFNLNMSIFSKRLDVDRQFWIDD